MKTKKIPTQEEVREKLGEEFISRFVESVEGATADFKAFKKWHPDWAVSFSSRFIANFLHERIWARLKENASNLDSFEFVDKEPIREVHLGTELIMRIKRHDSNDRISSYPTRGAQEFWNIDFFTIPGLESFSLALGYHWDKDLREPQDALLTLYRKLNEPIWSVKLSRDSANIETITWEPITNPSLPEIDLAEALAEDYRDVAS
ncbi:MAG: hypothetical protein SPK50_04240 [Mobiluncus porci]|uniref:Uncharacterized protein n=1 Tax=Mobiluncus porci TaxID=2652278 RepID=A0A7K0K1M6_9ACTO|nr:MULTISPECIES: hypothetical protein [Mobiluncus]MCI6584235.1 hypothetical protein [Mobiluncus sp.]MDD7540764.1 hypothetical protein [Mobiluncus porci]MDY5748326.1 hypothetical protein [Mobiluncus porci]MST49391.1 hypothetical protein [Mobiluncus porci]